MSGQNESDKSSRDESARRPFNPDGGEDEGSTSQDGREDHLHDDQKPIRGGTKAISGSVDSADPHKAEKLTKAGRDIDPDEGSE